MNPFCWELIPAKAKKDKFPGNKRVKVNLPYTETDIHLSTLRARHGGNLAEILKVKVMKVLRKPCAAGENSTGKVIVGFPPQVGGGGDGGGIVMLLYGVVLLLLNLGSVGTDLFRFSFSTVWRKQEYRI